MRNLLAIIGGIIGFVFGAWSALGLIIGIVVGSLTGWLIELHPAGSGREIGKSLGLLYGMLIGALSAHYAKGIPLHFWVVVILYGWMGRLFVGNVLGGLIAFSQFLDSER